jgi:hypothetical protein
MTQFNSTSGTTTAEDDITPTGKHTADEQNVLPLLAGRRRPAEAHAA